VPEIYLKGYKISKKPSIFVT